MANNAETRVEQEFCWTFHKQVGIRITTLRACGQEYTHSHCLDAIDVAECLYCKMVNHQDM